MDAGEHRCIADGDLSITALALEPLPDAPTQVAFAATSSGRVYRTDNGGLNWSLGTLPRGLPGDSITALTIPMADPRVIYAALNGAGVYTSSDGAATWLPFASTGLSLDLAALAVDGTQSPVALYAATVGHGMYDFEIIPVTSPDIIPVSPGGPYPFESGSSSIDVVVTGLNTTKMLWSTNRGHAGAAAMTGGSTWTASAVPLEPGLNLITLTAVDGSSNESNSSITVNSDPEPVIFVSPSRLPFGTLPSAARPVRRRDGDQQRDGEPGPGRHRAGRDERRRVQEGRAQDLCTGATLAPTQSCTIGLRFKPTSSGAKSATLTIPSNDPVTPLATVSLSGTGGARR